MRILLLFFLYFYESDSCSHFAKTVTESGQRQSLFLNCSLAL